MGKVKVRTFLIICAAALSAPTWAGAFAASDGWNIGQSWFEGLLQFTWYVTPIVVATTMLYVLISFLPLEHQIKTARLWLALTWLAMATLALIGVTGIYLTAYKCGMDLINFLQTTSPSWGAVWVILITYMMGTISFGALLGEDKKLAQPKSWSALFVIIGGFMAVWTCILSTFGLTVWNILPACPN